MTSPAARRGAADPTACRSCGAQIVFARMSSGKRSPFQLDDDGEWIIIDGVASHQGKAPWRDIGEKPGVPRYTSHFATCPQATSWRGARK